MDGRIGNDYTNGGAPIFGIGQSKMSEKDFVLSIFDDFNKYINTSSGHKLGAYLGFWLATLYFWGIVLLITFGSGLFSLLVWVFYIVIAPLATIIGSFTGWALDNIIETWITSFSSRKATLSGVLFCSIIALPLNLPMGRRIFDPSDDAFWTYTLWITLPSLIYILAGSWIASRFYRIHANT